MLMGDNFSRGPHCTADGAEACGRLCNARCEASQSHAISLVAYSDSPQREWITPLHDHLFSGTRALADTVLLPPIDAAGPANNHMGKVTEVVL